MSAIIKMSAIAVLAIGVSAMGFAQNSVVSTMTNQSAIHNTQSTTAQPLVRTASSTSSQSATPTAVSTGAKGAAGSAGVQPANSVPEPASMLAVGFGVGLVYLKKRRK